MAQIYQARGNLIDQGVLTQYAAAKGGVLSGVATIGDQIARADARRLEAQKNLLEIDRLKFEMDPERNAAKLSALRAQTETAINESKLSTMRLQDANEAKMVEQEYGAQIATAYDPTVPDPNSIAGFEAELFKSDKSNKSPALKMAMNARLQQVAQAAGDTKYFIKDASGGEIPATFSQAMQFARQEQAKAAKNPEYIPEQARMASIPEVVAWEDARAAKIKAISTHEKEADAYLQAALRRRQILLEASLGKYKRTGRGGDLPELPGNLEWNDKADE